MADFANQLKQLLSKITMTQSDGGDQPAQRGTSATLDLDPASAGKISGTTEPDRGLTEFRPGGVFSAEETLAQPDRIHDSAIDNLSSLSSLAGRGASERRGSRGSSRAMDGPNFASELSDRMNRRKRPDQEVY